MENIIELIRKYMIEIEDDESLILYKGLIISHPDFHVIKHLPKGKSVCKFVPVSEVINDRHYIHISPENESFKEWIDALQTEYDEIINGKHN